MTPEEKGLQERMEAEKKLRQIRKEHYQNKPTEAGDADLQERAKKVAEFVVDANMNILSAKVKDFTEMPKDLSKWENPHMTITKNDDGSTTYKGHGNPEPFKPLPETYNVANNFAIETTAKPIFSIPADNTTGDENIWEGAKHTEPVPEQLIEDTEDLIFLNWLIEELYWSYYDDSKQKWINDRIESIKQKIKG